MKLIWSWLRAFALFSFLVLSFGSQLHAVTFDWASEDGGWTAGDLSRSYTNVAGSGIDMDVTVAGSTDDLIDTTPKTDSDGLTLHVDYDNEAEFVTLTMTFSKPVLFSSLKLKDFDTGTYVDRAVIWGVDTLGNIVTPSGVTLGSGVHQNAPGDYEANAGTDVSASTPSGQIDLQFQDVAVTEVSWTYQNGVDANTNPGQQYLWIDPVIFVEAIDAVDDDYTSAPVDGTNGGSTATVLGNDTHNGAAVVPADITLTPGAAPAPVAGSITMNANGTITVASGTTAGTYSYEYTICDKLNTYNCDTATATVVVDEAPILTIGDAFIPESGTLAFPVTLSSPSTTDITVTFEMTNGTADSSDYTTSDVQITILANQTTGTVNVPTTDDAIDESDENMTISVASVDAGTLSDITDTGTGTILDDDGAPNLYIGDVSVTESSILEFPVTLSNPSDTDITVTFQMTHGTASDSDYTTTDIQITIPAHQTTAVVYVQTTHDTIDESDETMTVSVASVDAGTLGDTSDTGTGTIVDDDGAPSLIIGDASVTEGGTLAFPVTLSNPSATATTVTLQMTNGTASDSDYTTTDVQITIPAGQTTATIHVPTTHDTIDESDEMMTVSVRSVDDGTLGDTSDTGTGTIVDDDGAPSLIIGDASVTEGGTLAFPVTLSNPSPIDITVTLQMTHGTASDSDYTTTDVQITIPAGQTTATIHVPTTHDTIDESDETMIVSVRSVDAGTLGDTSDTGTGTIVDDDGVVTDGPHATDNLDIPVTSYEPMVIDILGNGDDWGSNGPGTELLIFEQPTYGTLTLDDGGTPGDPTDDVLIYTPEPDRNYVTDEFTYTLVDAQGNKSTATVTLNIECVSSQRSDNGDTLSLFSMLLLAIMTAVTGFYFIRREEERGEVS